MIDKLITTDDKSYVLFITLIGVKLVFGMMKTTQVRQNSQYQRLIDRSFAVILHNLSRLRDDTSATEMETGHSYTKSTHLEKMQKETNGNSSHRTKRTSEARRPSNKRVSFSDEKNNTR